MRKTRKIRGGAFQPRNPRPSILALGRGALVSGSPFKQSKLIIPANNSKPANLLARIKMDDESFKDKNIEEADIANINDIINKSATLHIYLAEMQPIYTKYNIVANNSSNDTAKSVESYVSPPVYINPANSILKELLKLNPNNTEFETKSAALRKQLNAIKTKNSSIVPNSKSVALYNRVKNIVSKLNRINGVPEEETEL